MLTQLMPRSTFRWVHDRATYCTGARRPQPSQQNGDSLSVEGDFCRAELRFTALRSRLDVAHAQDVRPRLEHPSDPSPGPSSSNLTSRTVGAKFYGRLF